MSQSTIEYQLTADDLRAWQHHLMESTRAQAKKRFWKHLIISMAIAYGAVSAAPQMVPLEWSTLGTIMLLLTGSYVWARYWLRSLDYQKWLALFEGTYRLELSPAGIVSRRNNKSGFLGWERVVALEAAENHLLLYIRRDYAIVIPYHALADREATIDLIRTYWAEAPQNRFRQLPSSPDSTPGVFKEIIPTLREGGRIALGLKFDQDRFSGSLMLLAWMVAILLIVMGTVEYQQAFPNPAFNLYGAALYALLFTLILWATLRLAQRILHRSALELLVMISAAALLPMTIYLSISAALNHFRLTEIQQWLLPALIVWLVLIIARIVRAVSHTSRPAAHLISSGYCGVIFILGGFMPLSPIYYSDNFSEEEPYYSRLEEIKSDDLFYAQPGLVEAKLNTLSPRDTSRRNLYFIGFAGEAEEQVFTNEVTYAQALLDSRFGADGRSLALLNNIETIDSSPLATIHNLKQAIHGVAKKMDREKDVLFLFLSSHGAKNHELSVSLWPANLNPLKATYLKEILDSSGIKNRIIAVSACYSGGFLDVLKDDNSLIVTASSRDHVSYGCGDYTQYTYFGNAYFVNALSKQESFITAFETARHEIEQREKQEQIDHSNPQIHIGRNITAVLGDLKVTQQAVSTPGQ